jgi:predicted nucleic acid-binding protein
VSERELIVLDASVGVKWLKPEVGSDTARSLLADHRDGRVHIVVPAHFMHELVGVAVRHGGPDLGEQVWETLRLAGLTSVTLDDELASAAFGQCRRLGCSFYDALAPALAQLLGAALYSADAKAHSRFPGVRLLADIGE